MNRLLWCLLVVTIFCIGVSAQELVILQPNGASHWVVNSPYQVQVVPQGFSGRLRTVIELNRVYPDNPWVEIGSFNPNYIDRQTMYLNGYLSGVPTSDFTAAIRVRIDSLHISQISERFIIDPINGIDESTTGVLVDYRMLSVYPNPFNSTATIAINLDRSQDLTLKIHDRVGREVTTLTSGLVSAGEHRYKFDASHLSAGVYFITANRAGKPLVMQKAVLLK